MQDLSYNSHGNYYSYGNYRSDGNCYSNGNYCSNGNFYSYGNYYSHGNFYSNGNYCSYGNYHSYGNYCSRYNKNCKGIYKCLFNTNLKGGYCFLFNKSVSGERIDEVYDNLKGYIPDFTNYNSIKGFKEEHVKELDECKAYLSMPKDMIDYIKSLPEFDAEIFKEITGIDASKTKVIVVDGKEIEISEESYNAFREQFIGEL